MKSSIHKSVTGQIVSTSADLTYFDQAALIERLTNGLRRRNQEVVFLVGVPLSAPSAAHGPGVPDVNGIIELIRAEFVNDRAQLDAFDSQLSESGDKRYQSAFQFLLGRRGQQAANDIIRKAVLCARISDPAETSLFDLSATDDICRLYEGDNLSWTLSPGTECLGKLAVGYPHRFGKTILTTNFDPLIEIAIKRIGGSFYRTVLHADGNLTQTEGPGCHIIHLHGYWYGADTLHTGPQLEQARPKLQNSLAHLLRSKLVVVCGYGGWDDAFTKALMEIVRDDNAYPELLWTFYSQQPSIPSVLLGRLEPGIDRGRVTLYADIDCHRFFPSLYYYCVIRNGADSRDTWVENEPGGLRSGGAGWRWNADYAVPF